MFVAIVTTVLYTAASAFVPALPAEPYLIGLVATTDHAPVPLGIAAGVGQSAGKVLIFLVARGTIRSPWLRRWLTRLTGNPGGAASETAGAGAEVGAAHGATGAEAGTIGTAGATGTGTAPHRFARVRRAAVAVRAAVDRRVPPPLRRLGAATGRRLKAASVRLNRTLERPGIATLTVFASAVTGLPPLLAVSVYASATRMSVMQFGTVCVIGRSIRFVAIALAPTLFM